MVTYVIQQGDTLYKIANQYGVSVQEIINANPGINPYNLFPGQVIQIPSTTWQSRQSYQSQLTQQMPQLPSQQMPQLPSQQQQQILPPSSDRSR